MARDVKFVALGMTAEIIVIVENEDARLGPCLEVEISRGKAAYAAAHHHQIEFLTAVVKRGGAVPEISVAQFMRRFEGTGMAAPHTQPRGWIITRRALRQRLGACRRGQFRGKPARQGGDGRALQEIAPGDGAALAELFVALAHLNDGLWPRAHRYGPGVLPFGDHGGSQPIADHIGGAASHVHQMIHRQDQEQSLFR